MLIKLFGFSTFYVFLDFWHKSKKILIKNNNVKTFKTNSKQTKHAIQIAYKRVCALHKRDQIKVRRQSTQHIWDLRNCTNTNDLMEWFKPWTIERLGEDVYLLVVCVYEFKTHNFIFHQIPDEVVTYLCVLTSNAELDS